MGPEQEPAAEVGSLIRDHRESVETALVTVDREALRGLAATPEAVVSTLFTPAFIEETTDFPDLDAFLATAGAESVWDLGQWLDWVLDWHVLGNTRFWSWEWMVHAAVVTTATAEAVGPVNCDCGGHVTPITASAVEEPGRGDGRWVEYRCGACGATGRATRAPDGTANLDGLERP
ncbi:hypothetical protein [Haloglomus litoreum]|uniref:hypothetical protein n=1 Tax=Haloglomus litoreum TaxID=3034026 RepID=UPI0023E7808A|nr:hypothetical protein [Haloglomus sp. DT116]